MLKLIVSIVLTIVALFVCKKGNKMPQKPTNDHDGILLICLLPALTYFIISYGVFDLTIRFGKFLVVALSAIFSALWVQLLVVGKGVDYMRAAGDTKIGLMEICPLLTIFLMTDCLDGFGYNLPFTLGVGLMTIALYVKTNSLDLPISVHLVMNATKAFCDTFITAHAVDLSTYRILYLCNCAFLIILGIWVLQSVYKTTSAEEGKFNG